MTMRTPAALRTGRRPGWTRWALVCLVAFSFAVRLYDLDAKSLWSDEGLTLRRAEQTLFLVFENVNLIPLDPNTRDGPESEGSMVPTPDLHPPLYFLLMHVWIRIAGQSEFALRFPSVLAATLTLPLLYALARTLLSREAGLWAAVLAAFSPFYLWYAQEARMYTWVVVLSLASVHALLPLLERSSRLRDYAVYVAVTLPLLYTHYSGFLLLAFEVLIYGAYRLRRRPWVALVVLGLLAVALVPLAPYAWQTFLRQGLFAFEHRPLHLILAEAWSSFSLGLGDPVVRPLWQTAPFLVLFVVGLFTLNVSRRRQAWAVCLGYLFVPVLLLYALSFFRPNYMNPRHLMVVSPAWELIVAHGLATLRRRPRSARGQQPARRLLPAKLVLLGAVLLLRGQACYDVFTAHSLWKDDIRGVARYIKARARPGDAIVLHHPVIRLTFDYYYDGSHPETVIPRYGSPAHDTAGPQAEFASWSERYDRIWFLYGPPPTFFSHDFLPTWADANLFKVDEQGFEAWWTYVAVAAYDDEAPVFDALPADAVPTDTLLGPLRLVGVQAQELVAGQNAWLTFYWRVEGSAPDEPLTLAVRLRDVAGTVWVERTEQVLSFYPPAAWPDGQIVGTEFRLPLPNDVPPAAFDLEVEPVGLGEADVLGQVSVSRSPTPAPVPVPRPKARFEGGVDLLQSELAGDTFRAGYPLLGSVTWRATATPSAAYRVRIRLVDPLGRQVAASEVTPSAAGFPTSAWLPGDLVAGRLALPLPANLTDGRYRVQVGLVDPRDGTVVPARRWWGKREWVTVGSVRVEAWPLVTQLPGDVTYRLDDARLGEAIHLRGYDLAREGETLKLTLYWQADAALAASYHVFAHVATPGAPPVAQADGVPGEWWRPTTTWRVGEVIGDAHTISLVGVPPGRYNLLVGMYDPAAGGQRPTTTVDGEIVPEGYVLLQEIEVAESTTPD